MKLHRNEKFIKWGLTAFLVFVACALFWIVFSNFPGFYKLIQKFFGIISPLLYGALFAYLMNPVMEWTKHLLSKWFSRSKKMRNEKRKEKIITAISIASAVLFFSAVLVGFGAIVVPSIVSTVEELFNPEQLQYYYDTANKWVDDMLVQTGANGWLYENAEALLQDVYDFAKTFDVQSVISGVWSSAVSVAVGVFNAVVGIIAAIYILIYKKQLSAQAKKVVVSFFNTAHANRIFEVSRRSNRIFGGYVIGKLLDALLVGIITYVVMLIMGMPYASLIAVLVGATNIIPFFGPFIGAVPSVLLLLLDKPINAVYFVIFIIVLQMIDGYIIENRILGEKLGLSDLWVLASILIFGGVFGFAGMLLGVPIFAVLYSLVSDWVNRRLARKRYPLNTNEYFSLKCVEDLPVEPAPSRSFVSVEPAYDMNTEPEDEEIDDEE